MALPATMRPPGDTKKNILYRDNFTPLARDEGLVVENLHSDIMAQSNIQPGGSLAVTLGLDKIKPPTQEILDLYKTITAHYVGVGFIHPMKDYRNFIMWMEPTPTYVSLPTQNQQETHLRRSFLSTHLLSRLHLYHAYINYMACVLSMLNHYCRPVR